MMVYLKLSPANLYSIANRLFNSFVHHLVVHIIRIQYEFVRTASLSSFCVGENCLSVEFIDIWKPSNTYAEQ
jgi:hypothetical protein